MTIYVLYKNSKICFAGSLDALCETFTFNKDRSFFETMSRGKEYAIEAQQLDSLFNIWHNISIVKTQENGLVLPD